MAAVNANYKIAQDFKYEGDDWWTWWVWIEGSKNDLDLVDYVIYTLHSTFRNPVRKITNRESKFRLETEGWGTFTIYAKVVLKNKEEIPLEHELNLEYPSGMKSVE
jgi:transcription initiation factor IIF auxiliary subunit